MAWCPRWIGIGNEAIQKVELWVNVVINEATSGADLIVPRQGASVGQSARAAWGEYLMILVWNDDGEVFGGGVGRVD